MDISKRMCEGGGREGQGEGERDSERWEGGRGKEGGREGERERGREGERERGREKECLCVDISENVKTYERVWMYHRVCRYIMRVCRRISECVNILVSV